jgi:hypothetical protein
VHEPKIVALVCRVKGVLQDAKTSGLAQTADFAAHANGHVRGVMPRHALARSVRHAWTIRAAFASRAAALAAATLEIEAELFALIGHSF